MGLCNVFPYKLSTPKHTPTGFGGGTGDNLNYAYLSDGLKTWSNALELGVLNIVNT